MKDDRLEIDAGDLIHRVQIQTDAAAGVRQGEHVADWQTIAERWALVDTLSQRERLVCAQQGSSASIRVTLRYDSTLPLTHNCRILFGERVLEVNEVIDVLNRHVRWDVRCTETDARQEA